MSVNSVLCVSRNWFLCHFCFQCSICIMNTQLYSNKPFFKSNSSNHVPSIANITGCLVFLFQSIFERIKLKMHFSEWLCVHFFILILLILSYMCDSMVKTRHSNIFIINFQPRCFSNHSRTWNTAELHRRFFEESSVTDLLKREDCWYWIQVYVSTFW